MIGLRSTGQSTDMHKAYVGRPVVDWRSTYVARGIRNQLGRHKTLCVDRAIDRHSGQNELEIFWGFLLPINRGSNLY